MDLDPDVVFADDEDDQQLSLQERESSKEYVVYIVDASPKMFSTSCSSEDKKDQNHFQLAISCISESLKSRIVNNSYDEIAICFFNTREKKNLQDINGVFVFSVAGEDGLGSPTARLIKEFDQIEESFMKKIGSQCGIVSGSRENSLYNALWVGQALLRKGSSKTADKRMLLFTNEDDPFGALKGVTKLDMTRTTLQRAKDAQDLGISIELLPLSNRDIDFNMSLFYADMLQLEGDALAEFIPSSIERLQDMKNQIRRRMFKKRRYRTYTLSIANVVSIQLSAYALLRPTVPGNITWLDSTTNHPLKTERSLICADTGALMQEAPKQFLAYRDQEIKFSREEISQIKRVSLPLLYLLGFKPLSCLKDHHNLKPSTFLYPTDEDTIGSTKVFIALHRSMLRLRRYAVAYFGCSTHPQLVALIAQGMSFETLLHQEAISFLPALIGFAPFMVQTGDEVISGGGLVEPPGMHMIYLPYCDDIRNPEELHMDVTFTTPRASNEDIQKATTLMKCTNLRDFTVCQFSNPALQKHYAVLQALALEEDEMPEIKDETLPVEESMARPNIVNAIEEFKLSVYGDKYEEGESVVTTEASKKRKAIAEKAVQESANYNWEDLADNGKLKDLTVTELKYYLSAHKLPVTGKKEALISRILTHMRK